MEYQTSIFQDDAKWKITLHRPILTEQQRAARMEKVKKATEELLREYIAKGYAENDKDTKEVEK